MTVASRPDPEHAVFRQYVERLETTLHEQRQQIDALMRRNAQLEEANIRDPTTGLLNRTGLMDRIERAYDHALAQEYRGDTYLGFIDIKEFKRANDEYGHEAGDQLLMRLATHLKHAFKITDHLGRFGGDEFLVILPRALARGEPALVDAIEHRVRRPFTALITDLDPQRLVDLNVGLAPLRRTDTKGYKQSIIDADNAMYHAKLLAYQGTPRTCAFDSTIDYGEIRFDLSALRLRQSPA